jgi:hypothetical protein
MSRITGNSSESGPLASTAATGAEPLSSRVESFDWNRIGKDLDDQGNAILERVLLPSECRELADLYSKDELFRSRVVMAQHGFGRGEYKYFHYPLPGAIHELRTTLYSYLVPVANQWNEVMGLAARFPVTHSEFLALCHGSGQAKATPLLLRYSSGDYNCLHQDLYGDHVFPLQVAILLSDPETDFTGGEFVMTEQRPRMQSRPIVAPLRQGDGVVFAVHHRPVKGGRGIYRVNLRHGVSRIRSGNRYTLGIILHDGT